MDSVSAIRSQLPVPAAQAQPAPDRVTGIAAAQSVRPVAAPMRAEAVTPPSGMAAQVAVELAERDRDRHPAVEARAAAQAARDAYIRASIAAGVSPLPLP